MARERTTLELVETGMQGEYAANPSSDALLELGMVHTHMRHLNEAIPELWAAMHGRSGLENLAIVAEFGSRLFQDYRYDTLALEQIIADGEDRAEAKQQRAAA